MPADEKCPICYNIIQSDDPTTIKFTDDPIKTPNHFLPELRGTTLIRLKHITELQKAINDKEEEFGITPLTEWSEIGTNYPPRAQHINELREAIDNVKDSVPPGYLNRDGILKTIGVTLADWLSYDENGEPTLGITEWLDGHRLDNKAIVRGMHIEQLRKGIESLLLEQWIKTNKNLPLTFTQKTNAETYGWDGGWQEGADKTYEITGDIKPTPNPSSDKWIIYAYNGQSNHAIYKKFGYPGEGGYVSFDITYTPPTEEAPRDCALTMTLTGYYNETAVNFLPPPGIAMALSNEAYLSNLTISVFNVYSSNNWLNFNIAPDFRFRKKFDASGNGTQVYNEAYSGQPGDTGYRNGYLHCRLRLFVNTTPINPDITPAIGMIYCHNEFTDDPGTSPSPAFNLYSFSALGSMEYMEFPDMKWLNFSTGNPVVWDWTLYKYTWVGIDLNTYCPRVALGSYTEGWNPGQSGSPGNLTLTIYKLGLAKPASP